jgi:1-phosphatidylinositol-3-phosphate 5-kinase
MNWGCLLQFVYLFYPFVVIPGGNIDDCAYISGVLFRKQSPNKNMTREILNPKILIISGGIEYNKNDSRLTTFGALLEQEERHLEVLINKITKIFSPDIVLIGRSVSRKAQDLFLKANILLLQSVKSALLERISRQTGAMILSSAEIINQGTNALGTIGMSFKVSPSV